MTQLNLLPSHNGLVAHATRMADHSILDLFRQHPNRVETLSISAGALTADFSKQKITPAILAQLQKLTEENALTDRIDALFSGAQVNRTEHRPALHTAIRDPENAPDLFTADGPISISQDVTEGQNKLDAFVHDVWSGQISSHDGRPFKHVINIGIGGSDLGPKMVSAALRHLKKGGPEVFYVSNIDGSHLHDAMAQADPQRTLLVVTSKSFGTLETIMNAKTAIAWLQEHGVDPSHHLVAVTARPDKAMAFGVADNRIFQMRDWIGGRFSLWSAAGVSCALDLGVDVAAALRQGAYDMDQHFHTAPFAHNMPVMMAMIGLWNTTYLGYNTLAVLPYAQALHRLPAYLQQLEMESNGKSMSINAEPLQYPTCPVIFGEAGANGQHSFHQLLHQSNTIVPSDFIVPFAPTAGPAHHHIALMANAFAQSEALMAGRSLAQAQAMLREKGISEDEITHQAPHWVCPGNRPSTTITMPALTAEALGALIALYEHKVYVQGVMWGINSFDQFGVELGKTLAKPLENALCTGAPAEGFSPSTQNLLARAQQANQARSNEASSIASITHAIPAHA